MKNAGKKIHAIIVASVFLLSTFMATGALATDLDATAAAVGGTPNNIVGLGVGFAPDYEGSEDMKAIPLLQARFNFENDMYIGLLGNTLKVNLVPSKSWNAGPLLRYRAERDDVDNDRVDRMEDVDAAVELGAFLNYNYQNWIFAISAAQDVSDAHDGYVIDFGVGYRYMIHDRAILTVFGKGSYASDDYMDTYFSVDVADSLRSGLEVYDADDAEFKDVGVGALLQYNITDNWGVLGVLQYTRLLGDAKDSPVVDDEGDPNQFVGGLIVNYRF